MQIKVYAIINLYFFAIFIAFLLVTEFSSVVLVENRFELRIDEVLYIEVTLAACAATR